MKRWIAREWLYFLACIGGAIVFVLLTNRMMSAGTRDKELETVVQKMIDAGEPEDRIATVIRHYDDEHPVRALFARHSASMIIGGAALAFYLMFALVRFTFWAIRTVRNQP